MHQGSGEKERKKSTKKIEAVCMRTWPEMKQGMKDGRE